MASRDEYSAFIDTINNPNQAPTSAPPEPKQKDEAGYQEYQNFIKADASRARTTYDDEIPLNGSAPDRAIPYNPLGLGEEFNLAAGRSTFADKADPTKLKGWMVPLKKPDVDITKTQLGYLTKKFQDIAVDPEHGLVVLDKDDHWKQLNPDITAGRDPYEIADALAHKTLKLGTEFIPSLTGKAGLPGAVLAGGLRGALTSWGRFVGTYDATPQEQAADMGLEAAANLLGSKIGEGAKAGALKFAGTKAGQDIAAFGAQVGEKARPTVEAIMKPFILAKDRISTSTKDSLSSFLTYLNGGTKAQTQGFLDYPDQVMRELGQFAFGGARSAEGKMLKKAEFVDKLENDKTLNMTALLKKAPKYLYDLYGDKKEKFLSQKGIESFSTDLTGSISQAARGLIDLGIVKQDVEAAKKGVIKWVSPDANEFAKLLDEAPIDGAPTKAAFDKALHVFNQYANEGKVVGRKGAERALEFKTALDDMFSNLIGNTEKSQARNQVINEVRQSVRSNIVDGFKSNPNLSQGFQALNDFYSQRIDYITAAQKLAGDLSVGAAEGGKKLAGTISKPVQSFVRKVYSDDVTHNAEKEMLRSIIALKPDVLGKLDQNARVANATQLAVNWLPQYKIAGNNLAGAAFKYGPAGAVGGSLAGPVGAAVGVTGTAVTGSPLGQAAASYIGRNTVNATAKLLNFTRSLSADAAREMLDNPALLGNALRIAGAHAMEDFNKPESAVSFDLGDLYDQVNSSQKR